MISNDISRHVVTVGPSIISPSGGIGMLIHLYSEFYEDFKFIDTYNGDSPLSKFFNYFKALIQLIKLFHRDNDIKIVHVHGASNGSFIRKSIVIIISKLAHKKIIYHIHGGGFKVFSQKHKFIVSHILGKCDGIIALSNKWKTFFDEEFHHSSVSVVPNTLPYPKEDHSIRNKEVCTFLFLGKICKEKGIYDLLELLSIRKEKYKEKIRLLIGGNGEVEKLVNEIEKLHLSDMVEFKGWVENSEKADLFNKSDIFILPSYYEGVPISILEAFSYHIPVISTNVGGIPEILTDGQNGILISPGSKVEMEEAIDRLISSASQRQEWGNKAFDKSLQYMPSKIEKKLTTIYSQLLIDEIVEEKEMEQRKSC